MISEKINFSLLKKLVNMELEKTMDDEYRNTDKAESSINMALIVN